MPSDGSLPGPARSPHDPRGWARCVVLSAALLACGGLAADGQAPAADDPEGAEPEEPSRPAAPVRGTCNAEPQLPDCTSATPPPVMPERETCEDNPLLAGCVIDATLPLPDGQGPALPDEEMPLYVAAARNVLLSYCGVCHGSALTAAQASAAINYIDDWDALLERGLIRECSPESSPVVDVMRTGEMPPPSSGLPLASDLDIGVVVLAIELDCYDR